jgi:hypothetical protein
MGLIQMQKAGKELHTESDRPEKAARRLCGYLDSSSKKISVSEMRSSVLPPHSELGPAAAAKSVRRR